MAARNSSLQNIFSQSFPGSSLFDISLVKDTNPEIPFYKNKYFIFLSLAPGTNQNGRRTFDVNNRIVLKTDCYKVGALAHSIKLYARGLSNLAKYNIFVDSSKSEFNSGGGQKMIFVSDFIPNGKDQSDRQVSISFRIGKNPPKGVFFYPAEALSIADVLEFIAKKGLELEFSDRHIEVGEVRNPPNRQHSRNNQNNYNRNQNGYNQQNQNGYNRNQNGYNQQNNFDNQQNNFDNQSPDNKQNNTPPDSMQGITDAFGQNLSNMTNNNFDNSNPFNE